MSKKGIYLDVVDFGVLREMLSRPPVYVNDLDTIVVENKQALNDLLITRYESDTLESMPICECKATYGAEKAGRICPECGHTVMVPTERPIESRLWIRAPKGVKGLINPLAWNILTKAFKVEGISMVEYLTGLVKPDPRKKPNSAIEKFRAIGVQPGINYFIDNFDMLIDFMLTARMTSKNRVEREKLRAFIERNKLKFFPQALPIPSKLAFIVESTETGTFADSSMGDALDAVRTITRLAHAPRAPSLPERELAAARCCSQLATFYERQVSQALGPKKGLLRRHVFGSRPPFSCRAVITSIPEAHHYQEVHFPWGMSVQLFEEHLKSKLDRLGYSFSVIRKILSRAVLTYSPLIDHLMKEIISESPVGVTRENGELAPGMPILLQRNPTLKRLSAQYVFITKVKTDPSINTISMSTLILKGPNADFDGDQLNCLLILDPEMRYGLGRLAPHLGVQDYHQPYSVSGDLALPAPTLATINEWLRLGRMGADLGPERFHEIKPYDIVTTQLAAERTGRTYELNLDQVLSGNPEEQKV